jgi:hypothetical protein
MNEKKTISELIKIEIISDILSSGLFKSILTLNGEETFNFLNRIISNFALHRLRPWGIPLIVICDNEKKYYVLESFLNTELEKIFIKELIETIVNGSNQNYKNFYEQFEKNYGKDAMPWFLYEIGESGEVLELKLIIEGKEIKCYIWRKEDSIFDPNDIKEMLESLYGKLITIINNYKKIYKEINIKIEKAEQEKRYNPEWLFNSLADQALIISLCIMELENLLDGFFLILWKEKDGKIQVKYLPRPWQKEALNNLKLDEKLNNLTSNPFDILKEKGFPPELLQSGFAIVTGVTQLGNPLSGKIWKQNKNEIEEEYPSDLIKLENVIWDPIKYKVLYAPLNESTMNRFLIALRIPKDENPSPFDIYLLEKFLNKMAYPIKLAFCESLLPKEDLSLLEFMLFDKDELPELSIKRDDNAINFTFYHDFLQNSKAIRDLIEESGKIKIAYDVSHFLKNTVEQRKWELIIDLEKKLENKVEFSKIRNIIFDRFDELHGITNLINSSIRGYFREGKECEVINPLKEIPKIINETLEAYVSNFTDIKIEHLPIVEFEPSMENQTLLQWTLPKRFFWRAIVSEWIKDMLSHFKQYEEKIKEIIKEIKDIFCFVSLVRLIRMENDDRFIFSLMNLVIKGHFEQELEEGRLTLQPASGKGSIISFFELLSKNSCKIILREKFQDLKEELSIEKDIPINNNELCWLALIVDLQKSKLNIRREE